MSPNSTTILHPLCARSARGSALLIVLWVVAFLAFLIVTGMMVVSQDVETTGARKLTFRARQLAEMGVTVASHPMVNPEESILVGRISETEAYEAIITTEESLLNLNALLTEERRHDLERLFMNWGLLPAEAQTLVSAMMDWTDADDLPRLNSAEKTQYLESGFQGRPANRPFRSLDEVALVAGMNLLSERHPHWREAFTLWGKGRLDINRAAPELISIASGLPLHAAESLVANRDGPDGKTGTSDDTLFTDFDEALAPLGVSGEDAANLSTRLTLQSETTRIESTGRVGDHSRTITVIIKKSDISPKILEWRESTGE